MNRNELIALYKKNTPLKSNDTSYRLHVSKLEGDRDPSETYDSVILEARRKWSNRKADAVMDSRKVPDGSSISSFGWKARRPTVFDVEALADSVGYSLDPVTQEPLVRKAMRQAKAHELTMGGYYELAYALLCQVPAYLQK